MKCTRCGQDRLKQTTSPTRYVYGIALAFRNKALWTLLEVSKYVNAFFASALAW